MDNLTKQKKIRGVLRAKVTRFLNKLDLEFDQLDNESELEQNITYLSDCSKQVKELDDSIQSLITDDKEFETEIDSAVNFSEKIMLWNAKLTTQLKMFRRKIESEQHKVNKEVTTCSNVNNCEVSFSSQFQNVKLPKLNIEKYFGDPCCWLEFWNKYENSIDKNESLSVIDKFSYLKSLLGGVASNVVNGFALTEKNYEEALKLLKQRFGRNDLVINAHMNKLLNLNPVKDTNNVLGLRRLYDTCEVQIRSLESLGVNSSMYGHLLYPILIKLIPDELALEFNRRRLDKENNSFDVIELLKFLKLEIECRESSIMFQNSRVEKRKPLNNHSGPKHEYSSKYNSGNVHDTYKSHSRSFNPNNIKKATEFLTPISGNSCIYCSENHSSEFCHKMTVDEKKEILRKQARCFLCLEPKHRIKDCTRKDFCNICNHKHNRSICFQFGKSNEDKVVTAISHCHGNRTDNLTEKNTGVLLQTCTALIKSSNDKKEPVRLLLDSGSMKSFVNSTVSKKLNLPVIRTERLSVYAFGVKEATEKNYDVVKIHLENRDEPSLNVEIEALVTDQISATNIPAPDTNLMKSFKQLKNLQLADSYHYKDSEIVILVGSDFYFNIVSGRIKRLNSKLVASETLFGWCFLGQGSVNSELLSMKVVVEEKTICDQLKTFWDLESIGISSEVDTKDEIEEEIMKNFEEGISYHNKRYKVKLPWKPEMKEMLENNKDVAHRRFQSLKKCLTSDPSVFVEYQKVLNDYQKENIIEPVGIVEQEKQCFYLPHRAVIKNDKSTSRLRIVFDASAHGKEKISLNNCLYSGLNLLPDLFLLLIKFRSKSIAVTSDIKAAFLQIEIDESDRDYTRFFWCDNVSSKDLVYRMTRVLFGVTSSPFLLNATIKHHLKRYVEIFAHTCQILDDSLYVDDCLLGEDTVTEALEVCTQSYDIFKEASMHLRKWRTNSPDLASKLEELGFEVEKDFDDSFSSLIPSKVLGVGWNSKNDVFYFDTQGVEKHLIKNNETKRYILQVAGRLFDPIGFLGPYTIRIKCLLQEIWCLGLDWDEKVPNQTAEIFKKWCDDIEQLRDISVPRYYFANASSRDIDNIQLHLFADASIKAYGTVAYLRIRLQDSTMITSFVSSKARVAPLKTLSLPRLELMGALLSARLSDKIMKGLNFPVSRIFWTDSSITYFWIKNSPDRFKVFVKNRVNEIHKYSNPSEWFHCPGKDNPADLISRGISVSELKRSDLWWHGPPWLREDESNWPRKLETSEKFEHVDRNEGLEVRAVSTLSTTTSDKNHDITNFINRYSSFSKLSRITAYLIRFRENCKLEKDARVTGSLSSVELQRATDILVKCVQRSEFHEEIKCLKKNQSLPKSSKVLSLNVFLDQDGFLKVGGRLQFSELAEPQKHQKLLPKSHHFTKLLIEHCHKKAMHSGTQTTLYLIRQQFWIPSGQDTVRRVLNKCLTCFRMKTRNIHQIMGNLPKDRIVPSRPFSKVGIDFAGPILTKPNLKRSKITIKSYIAIFICFCTKAVHLEIVSDLTTAAFLACLRRFIARRSRPSMIWSDNATNFRGAKNILDSLFQMCQSDPIQKFSSDEGIQWTFSPAASPHFGGLWEANIKSMKRLLLKVTRSNVLNFEELNTIIVQIESILNSRPLCPMSTDPNDLQPLTPSHFLIGAPILSFPEPLTAPDSLSLHSRWSLIQSLRQQFWRRWSDEYLNQLQNRKKWKQQQDNLHESQLVLLKESNKIPLEWSLGRILKTYPGDDGMVRVVDVRTSKGVFRRSITKVVPLPFEQDVGQPSNGGRDVPSSN